MQRIRLPRGDGSLHDYTMQAYLKYHAISKAVDYNAAFDPSLADKAAAELGKRPDWH